MEDSPRVEQLLEVADQLLAELQDTVFDDCPPEFDEPDTVIDAPRTFDDAPLLDTLTTEPAPTFAPVRWSAIEPAPAPPAPRRSWFRAALDAIKGWLGLGDEPEVAPAACSQAFTYTMADRAVAQRRALRR